MIEEIERIAMHIVASSRDARPFKVMVHPDIMRSLDAMIKYNPRPSGMNATMVRTSVAELKVVTDRDMPVDQVIMFTLQNGGSNVETYNLRKYRDRTYRMMPPLEPISSKPKPKQKTFIEELKDL